MELAWRSGSHYHEWPILRVKSDPFPWREPSTWEAQVDALVVVEPSAISEYISDLKYREQGEAHRNKVFFFFFSASSHISFVDIFLAFLLERWETRETEDRGTREFVFVVPIIQASSFNISRFSDLDHARDLGKVLNAEEPYEIFRYIWNVSCNNTAHQELTSGGATSDHRPSGAYRARSSHRKPNCNISLQFHTQVCS